VPLARIITRFPEESQELAENLRSRGFEVQTESPGKTSAQPVDLEITIEECDAEEALQRATAVKDACAFVMPGAITGGLSPITAIPFIPQTGVEESEAVGPEARATSAEVANLSRHGFPAERAHAEATQFGSTPISDLELQPSLNEDTGAMTFEPEHAAEMQPISPEQRPEEISAAASEPVLSHAEAEARTPEPEVVSTLSQVEEGSLEAAEEFSDVSAGAEPVFAEGFQAEESHALELRADELQAEIEEPELASLSGDVQMRTEAVGGQEVEPPEPVYASADTLELKDAGTEVAAASASESPADKQAAAQQVVFEQAPGMESQPLSDWPIWQPISAEEEARETPRPAELPQPVPWSTRSPNSPLALLGPQTGLPRYAVRARFVRHPILTNQKVFWGTATLASVVALALLLGVSAHRLSPLPASLQQRSVDPQPSQTRPAAIVPADLKTVTRQPRARSRATRATKPADSLTTPRATTASKVNLASSKQPVIRAATDSGENGTDIAQDTVVRYGNRSGSGAVAPLQQKPPVKRNSDLN
jgi:hypothetical protein